MKSINRMDPRLPDPVESRRTGSGRVVRLIYALGLLGIGAFFLYRFGQPLVFLEGPGIVSAPRYIVSLPYTAHVEGLNVFGGIEIVKGDLIATFHAPEIDQQVTTLLSTLTDLAGQEASLSMKARVARASLEAARTRVRAANDAQLRLQNMGEKKTSLIYRADVMREAALSVQTLAQLSAEENEATAQLLRLEEVRRRIDEQLAHIRADFNDGVILSPVSGIVSSNITYVGETILPGGRIAAIFDQKNIYIDWYISDFRLVTPRRDDKVFVSLGNRTASGTVSEILPIAEVMGGRSRSILRDPEQGQVARVKLNTGEAPFPIGGHVSVRMNYLGFMNGLISGVLGLAGPP